jgi:serine/threonine protein kinase
MRDVAESQEEILQRVGRYELIRKIATSGMAELFLAKFSGPGGFEKRCALKRILPQFVSDEEFRRMFMNEARVAALFDHPNLVQIFELGEDPATHQFYIAMELINGMDLRQLQNLAREKGQSIPPELAAWLAAQSLDGLVYAHEFKDVSGKPLNFVYRDVFL